MCSKIRANFTLKSNVTHVFEILFAVNIIVKKQLKNPF